MLTSTRIERLKEVGGIGWVSCLRAPAIRALFGAAGDLQLGLFDERSLADFTSPDYPGAGAAGGIGPDQMDAGLATILTDSAGASPASSPSLSPSPSA